MMAVDPEPGIPRAIMGIRAPPVTALFAVSDAKTPSMEPFPNSSGRFERFTEDDEDGHGEYLGEFTGEDKVLAVFKDGTYYTTSCDLLNKYQGEVIRIEKLDTGKTYTALYWDAGAKAFYVKRFSFTESENNPVSLISDTKGSKLVAISDDLHPTVILTFGGKYAHREEETIDAEEFIAKKGLTAKGKKCHAYDLKAVRFGEPLVKPGDEEPEEPEEPEEAEDAEAPVIPGEAEESEAPVIPSAPPVIPSEAEESPDEPFDREPTLF